MVWEYGRMCWGLVASSTVVGASPRLTATELTPGYHVFSILATDRDGKVRTADPKLVVVKSVRADVGK
jgi:hypothetical protein